MLYVRALPSDAARWNASDWGWDVLERRYLQLEDWQGDVAARVAESPGSPRAGADGSRDDRLEAISLLEDTYRRVKLIYGSQHPHTCDNAERLEIARMRLEDFRAA